MEKIELGVNWELFRAGRIAYNVRSDNKNDKFLAELMKAGLNTNGRWGDYNEDTAYMMADGAVKHIPTWRVTVGMTEFKGCKTKENAAKSKGFASRKKGPTADSKAPYAEERAAALESGALTSFEAQLIGSLGICANELIQIREAMDNVEIGNTVLFRWGDSRKIIEVAEFKCGASKKVYHLRESGANSDGFVIKWNYNEGFHQVKSEYERYKELGEIDKKAEERGEYHHELKKLVSAIYRYDNYLKGGKHRVHNIGGRKCDMVEDGVLYSEYCHGVGKIEPSADEEKKLSLVSWDLQKVNMGRKRTGELVLVDYGVK